MEGGERLHSRRRLSRRGFSAWRLLDGLHGGLGQVHAAYRARNDLQSAAFRGPYAPFVESMLGGHFPHAPGGVPVGLEGTGLHAGLCHSSVCERDRRNAFGHRG